METCFLSTEGCISQLDSSLALSISTCIRYNNISFFYQVVLIVDSYESYVICNVMTHNINPSN